MSAEAAMAACQLLPSTSVTTFGLACGAAPLKTARATAAASALASVPATRVVFLVANSGKPSEVSAVLPFVSCASSGLVSVVERPQALNTSRAARIRARDDFLATGNVNDHIHARPEPAP